MPNRCMRERQIMEQIYFYNVKYLGSKKWFYTKNISKWEIWLYLLYLYKYNVDLMVLIFYPWIYNIFFLMVRNCGEIINKCFSLFIIICINNICIKFYYCRYHIYKLLYCFYIISVFFPTSILWLYVCSKPGKSINYFNYYIKRSIETDYTISLYYFLYIKWTGGILY